MGINKIDMIKQQKYNRNEQQQYNNCIIEQMLNKNVADFTNFDGKTNKRIVQAPGGATSISLAWSDQKTDYGSERHIKGLHKDKYSADLPQRQPANRNQYSQRGGGDYSPYSNVSKQPSTYTAIGSEKLGGEYGYKNYGGAGSGGGYGGYGAYGGSGYSYQQQFGAGRHNVYGNDSRLSGGMGMGMGMGMGSPINNNNNFINQQIDALNFGIKEYQKDYQKDYQKVSHNDYTPTSNANNYNNYNNNMQAYQPKNNYQNNGNYGNYNQPNSYSNKRIQSLDIAMNQQYKNRPAMSIHSNQSPQYQFKPSVKINTQPKSNFLIGDSDYNYWKDNEVDSQRKIHSNKRIENLQQQNQYQVEKEPPQRTSVKVHNPPGGKQSFTLG